jgi:hypothetical protein
VDSSFARNLAIRILRDTSYRHGPPYGPELQWQAAPVWFRDTCLVAIAYFSGDPYLGAFAIARRNGAPVFSDTVHRATNQLLVTAHGHPVYVYNEGWGSGLWTTRAVALYPLAAELWIQSLDIPVDVRIAVGGSAASFQQYGTLLMIGNVLVLRRRISTAYADTLIPGDTLSLLATRIEIP